MPIRNTVFENLTLADLSALENVLVSQSDYFMAQAELHDEGDEERTFLEKKAQNCLKKQDGVRRELIIRSKEILGDY